MGYVTGFEYDIYVSYNSTDKNCKADWVTTFVRLLGKRLSRLLGERDACKIFLDTNRNESSPFDPRSMEALESSATLLTIFSADYRSFSSVRHHRELEVFQTRSAAAPAWLRFW